MTLVHPRKDAIKFARPALRRVGRVLRRAEGVVGDEHLLPFALVRAKHIVGVGAFVHLPAGGELRQSDHPGDCRLPHLGRTRKDAERVPLENVERAHVRRSGDEDARELRGHVQIAGGPAADGLVDQRLDRPKPKDCRHGPPEAWACFELGGDLIRPCHGDVLAFDQAGEHLRNDRIVERVLPGIGKHEKRGWRLPPVDSLRHPLPNQVEQSHRTGSTNPCAEWRRDPVCRRAVAPPDDTDMHRTYERPAKRPKPQVSGEVGVAPLVGASSPCR
ncbi:MAG: hypothetical protein E6G07_03160 [Actinobacteria bacterium]|nr:MAG: hypothetical protein E6G07_03160 [Actinomycetota bacterium]